MQDEDEPQERLSEAPEADGPGGIVALTEEERAMLHEFAAQLRDHDVRNPVAREALDRAAEQLERVATSARGKA